MERSLPPHDEIIRVALDIANEIGAKNATENGIANVLATQNRQHLNELCSSTKRFDNEDEQCTVYAINALSIDG